MNEIDLEPTKNIGSEYERLQNNIDIATREELHAREQLDAARTMITKRKWHREWRRWAICLLMHRAAFEEYEDKVLRRVEVAAASLMHRAALEEFDAVQHG